MEQIGVVKHISSGAVIRIDSPYLKGLAGLSGFGHINVLWWFSNCDNPQSRSIVSLDQPYRNAPETIGVFASRSEERPNPIALTTSEVLDIDYEQGEIFVTFIDAEDGSPVLDIKPYMAQWLHSILETEGIKRPVLVGQSMGGYVSQAFIQRYPGEVSGFISIDSAPLKRKYYPKWELRLLHEHLPIHWIAGAGHNSNTDKPEKINGIIKSFI